MKRKLLLMAFFCLFSGWSFSPWSLKNDLPQHLKDPIPMPKFDENNLERVENHISNQIHQIKEIGKYIDRVSKEIEQYSLKKIPEYQNTDVIDEYINSKKDSENYYRRMASALDYTFKPYLVLAENKKRLLKEQNDRINFLISYYYDISDALFFNPRIQSLINETNDIQKSVIEEHGDIKKDIKNLKKTMEVLKSYLEKFKEDEAFKKDEALKAAERLKKIENVENSTEPEESKDLSENIDDQVSD